MQQNKSVENFNQSVKLSNNGLIEARKTRPIAIQYANNIMSSLLHFELNIYIYIYI